jgi:hypothetical protein
VTLDAFFFRHSHDTYSWKTRLREKWWWHMAATAIRFIGHWKAMPAFVFGGEGDARVTQMEVEFGRIIGFVYDRRSYADNMKLVRNAPWKRDSQAYLALTVNLS